MNELLQQIFIDANIPFNSIRETRNLHGGDINEVLFVATDDKEYCVKINSASRFPEMFSQEALGLTTISENSKFRIPNVIRHGVYADHQYLILEYIHPGIKKIDFWTDFGKTLADLHRTTQNKFGLHENNYIGSLLQVNTFESTWSKFFGEHRILKQIKLGVDNAVFSKNLISDAEKLCIKLDDLFPIELPALLHGDLWSGNYMIDDFSEPCLIDPAIYYGHREMDIAMMHLFGGFNDTVFETYNEVFPLQKGWKSRIQLCNLYPILVHANLFGGHYISQAKKILTHYT